MIEGKPGRWAERHSSAKPAGRDDPAEQVAALRREMARLKADYDVLVWEFAEAQNTARHLNADIAFLRRELARHPLRRGLAAALGFWPRPGRRQAEASPRTDTAGAAESGTPREVNTIRSDAPTAVLLHLHYPDLRKELDAHIASIPGDYHLYVSVTDADGFAGIARALAAAHREVRVRLCENRGRDIWPMLSILAEGLDRYRYVCKIHSKKSVHTEIGAVWRKDVLNQILHSRKKTEAFFACFDRFPDLGIIGPDGHRLTDEIWWGEARSAALTLARRMGVPEAARGVDFFAGSMFWFRPAALRPLAALGLTREDFPPEAGQTDGTPAHAIERCFNMSAAIAGFRVTDTAEAHSVGRALLREPTP